MTVTPSHITPVTKSPEREFLDNLTVISDGLDKAFSLLESTAHASFNPKQREDFENAKKILSDFKDAFVKVYDESQDIESKKSLMKSVIVFIGDLKEKFKDRLKGLTDHPLCKAVGGIIQNACSVVLTEVHAHLNTAIAIGKFAESVVELGQEIKNLVSKSARDVSGKSLSAIDDAYKTSHKAEGRIGEMPKFIGFVSEAERGLKEAAQLLQITLPKSASYKLKSDVDKAKQLLKEFTKEFTHVKQDVANIDFASPLKKLADSKEYRSSFESLIMWPVDKAQNVADKPLCKAVLKVITSACNVLSVEVKGQLNSAIAIGKLAQSVKDLANAVGAIVNLSKSGLSRQSPVR